MPLVIVDRLQPIFTPYIKHSRDKTIGILKQLCLLAKIEQAAHHRQYICLQSISRTREVKEVDSGYKNACKSLKILYYADDAALIAENVEDP